MKNLPLCRTAVLLPEFAEHTVDDDGDNDLIYKPVAVHDVCGSVAFVYWITLKQYL